jgi:ABC-type polysaccharide/polyol phosphate export permease
MEHVITREFSISRDWKSIAWGATLWHNALRAACAGLVFAVLGLALGGGKAGGPDTGFLLSMPLILPIGYLLFYMPLGMVCAFLSRFIPFIGIIAFMCALFVLPGDPIVWVLSIVAPRVVPMAKPGFMNFALIMWVLKPEDAVEVTITNTTSVNKL